MRTRTTHTYAILGISSAAYQEIREKLLAAGYQHTFHISHDLRECIDMMGIAVQEEAGCETQGDDSSKAIG